MSGKLLNWNLAVRTLSGVALLVVVMGCVLLSEWSFGALLVVICAGCLGEFYRLATMSGANPQRNYGTALGVVMVATVFFVVRGNIMPSSLVTFLPLAAVVFIAELYRKQENPLANVAITLAGVLYIALPLALMFYMAAGPAVTGTVYRPWVALSYIFIVWANDVGAYLFGVGLGRHRLFERISPKKSWEGFFGGLLVAIVVAAFAGHLMGFSPLVWGGLGFVVAVSGVFGDLVESMFKRAVNVKDSGAILPGHGGFLDRFDALLLSLPFAFVYFISFDL